MIGFGYLYNKDRDKRKLMFLLAFFLVYLKHISNLAFWGDNDYIINNLSDWAPFPMICAFLIAAVSSTCKINNFDKAFKAYLVSFVATIILIVTPIPSNAITSVIVPLLSASVIIVAIVSTVLNRELPNLMFLCSVLALVAVDIIRNLIDSSSNVLIFCYLISHFFLFLVFITSRNSNSNNISPFFSLQKRLEITQKELETSKERLVKVENIFSASPHPILVINLDGKLVEYNRATQNLYGFSDGHEFINKSYSVFIAKKDKTKIQEILQNVLQIGTITNIEFTAVDKQGIEFPAELSASATKDNLGTPTGFVIITEDITERKLMEDELRRHNEELEELVEERTRALKQSQKKLVKSERLAAIGQAATMVGHDLRNPLQAIENGVYILEHAIAKKEMPEIIKKTIVSINTSIEYADNIVKNLQSFTRIKQPVIVKTEINTLVEEVFTLVNKPNNIEIIFEPDILPKVDLDKDMMKRVFVNLASNAIHAMKENGGTLTVTTKKIGEFVEVSFKDTGIGISKEVKKKLFTAFFTTKAQGMGIGLAICKKFVDLHKGIIEVESTEGEGAEFTVKLPLKKPKVQKKLWTPVMTSV